MNETPHRRAGIAAFVAILVAGLLPGAHAAAAPMTSVIVQAASADSAAHAVRAAGGRVSVPLPIVNGVSARVPAGALDALRGTPGVRAVTANDPVRVMENGTAMNLPTYKHAFPASTDAIGLWANGVDGRGIRVALIDTGVSALPDLNGRIVPVPDPMTGEGLAACANFSGEATCDDSYGHGTFIAGLIAGNGSQSGGYYRGMAPGAEIVSIKIAGRDGSADVTKVLAAIQWVVSFKDRLGIDVLNLSLGTNSRASWRIDPLNFAVQRAWHSGLAVVVSAGNLGPGAGTIAKPADDPLVITVGAVDDRESPGISDDRLPSFSSRGPAFAGTPDQHPKPDVVAPGGHVIAQRAPGSFIEQHAPGGFPHEAYRRGSGTSMAAGVTSGAVALMLQANPSWRGNPDRVKFALSSTARKVAEHGRDGVGAGEINVYDAARNAPAGVANQWVTSSSDASGSLDASRADVLVTRTCRPLEATLNPNCDRVSGNTTGQDRMFNSDQYRGTWDEASWYRSQWVAGLMTPEWYGSSWYGSSWYGSSWYGSSWYGSGDNTFYGVSVAGSSWYGAWS